MTAIRKTATEEIAKPKHQPRRYAALETGQCRRALVTTMSLDARYQDTGSPKRNEVMRPRPADERLLTDVQVPPLAPHIPPYKCLDSTADLVGGPISTPEAVVSNHESGNLTLGARVWRQRCSGSGSR